MTKIKEMKKIMSRLAMILLAVLVNETNNNIKTIATKIIIYNDNDSNNNENK